MAFLEKGEKESEGEKEIEGEKEREEEKTAAWELSREKTLSMVLEGGERRIDEMRELLSSFLYRVKRVCGRKILKRMFFLV